MKKINRPAVPDQQQRAKLDMLNTELAQLVYDYPELSEIIDNDTFKFYRHGNFKKNYR